jgi:mRNA interferase MazF
MPGDIVLTPCPNFDGLVKPRPDIVLDILPPFNDALACGISTQLRHAVPGFDEFLRPEDDDFRQSGLKAASVIRLGYITVLMPDDVICRIGFISPARLKRLLAGLTDSVALGRVNSDQPRQCLRIPGDKSGQRPLTSQPGAERVRERRPRFAIPMAQPQGGGTATRRRCFCFAPSGLALYAVET